MNSALIIARRTLGAIVLATAAGAAHAQSDSAGEPAWVYGGAPEGVRLAWLDETATEVLSIGCASEQGGSRVNADMTLGPAIAPSANPILFQTSEQSLVFRPPQFFNGERGPLRIQFPRRFMANLRQVGEDAQLTLATDQAQDLQIDLAPAIPLIERLVGHCQRGAGDGLPSFVCTNAATATDGAVCRDPEASTLDRTVADTYFAASSALSGNERILAHGQNENWHAGRLTCEQDLACIAAQAEAFLASLEAIAPSSAPTSMPENPAFAAWRTNPDLARAEAATHGVDNAILLDIRGNTAFLASRSVTSGTWIAIHAVDAQTVVPEGPDRSTIIAELTRNAGLQFPEISLFHVRLGHPLPDGLGGRGTFGTAVVQENFRPSIAGNHSANRRLSWSPGYADAPRSWADAEAELLGREAANEAARQEALAAAAIARQAAQDAARASASEIIDSGQVYLSPGFWTDFYDPSVIRSIFHGTATYSPEAPALIRSTAGYVMAYSARCSSYLPADAVVFTDVETTRILNGFGVQLHASENIRQLSVHPRLAGVMAQHRRSESGGGGLQQGLVLADGVFSGRISLGDAINQVAGFAIDAQRLVTSFPCDSAPVRQLFENLVALTGDTPTLARTGIGVEGAAAYSDPVPGAAPFIRVSDACMYWAIDATLSAPFCRCLENRLVAPEREVALSDFASFMRDFGLEGSQADTPGARRQLACIRETAR
ncbi:lysozyme inhibitor LprI family protein [Jannaschia sp. CCS1]|uniref:lysozyme inhibitor LprI family protein n=1 Tax=Jannaschia sp. (strain CCS1) TaxID=290400 RepID=UPI000053BE9E|nr:hypothetical protein [Jannaschia sp. CCS1]ABD54940.1 hypothetical protein Jann_2023 [Jannaschia sp. CCS1]